MSFAIDRAGVKYKRFRSTINNKGGGVKRLFLSGVVLVATLGLGACQTAPSHPMPPAQSNVSEQPAVMLRQSVAIDRTMVYSYHLGVDAHRRTYLLVVLNDKGVNRLNETARRGQPYDITLDGQSYAQTAQVNSGFLVLTPASQRWTEQRLAQLLK